MLSSSVNPALGPQTTLPLLTVEGLQIGLQTPQGTALAVESVSFSLSSGQILGLVGESGCGKTLTSLAILGLLPAAARITAGTITFQGQSLTTLAAESYRKLRGAQMALIPQDPMSALNPLLTIGSQLAEVLEVHKGLSQKQALLEAKTLLEAVQIPNAQGRLTEYPHQFSGGMRQRVMIAMALACKPPLLIADEPTTALDVTVQAQILDLLRQLCREHEMALLLVTHDLGVVAELCDTVAVMYAGQLVETAPVERLFSQPAHPYTQGLLASIPGPGAGLGAGLINGKRQRLTTIAGQPPGPTVNRLPGCAFAPRCAQVLAACPQQSPALVEVSPHQQARCLLYPTLAPLA